MHSPKSLPTLGPPSLQVATEIWFDTERLLISGFAVFFFLFVSYLNGSRCAALFSAMQADALHSSLDMKSTPFFVANAAISIKPNLV